MELEVAEAETKRRDADIISVKDLFVTYSDGTRAVEGVSFDVQEGEFLGPNGYDWNTLLAAYSAVGLIAVVTLGATLYFQEEWSAGQPSMGPRAADLRPTTQ